MGKRLHQLPLVFALGLIACAGEPDPRPSVVVIVLDTLRADHVGVLGAGDGHTPVMDRLAAEGVLFDACFTQAPLTLPAVTSLLTSQWPHVHRVRDNYDERVSDRATTLTESFRDAGYRTAAFVSALPLRSETGLAQGFQHYDDDFSEPFPFYREKFKPLSERWTGSERRGANTVNRALSWMDNAAGPAFLFVHLFDPHSPYDAPEPFASRFETPYEGEVAYTDSLVGVLVDAVVELEAARGRPAPIVAVAADHGEGLGEHEEWAHGFFLYDSTLRVPWIVWAPDRLAPTRVSAPTRLIDVAPTLHALAFGAEASPPAQWAGADVLAAPEASRLVFAETWFPRGEYGWSELDAVVSGRWKWIRAPRPELYDLVADPRELDDQILARPDIAAALAAQRDSLHDAARARAAALGVDDLVEALTPEARVQEWLSNLGYIGSGGETPDGPLPDPKDMVPEWNRKRDARAHVSRGETLLDAGQPALALQAFRAAGEAVGTVEGWTGEGRSLVALGRSIEAEAPLTRALEENPNHIPALVALGGVKQAAGAWAEADTHLLRATLVDSTAVDAWRLRAVGLRALTRWPDAARCWERVVRAEPDALEARRELAAAYRDGGDTARAATTYREVVGMADTPDPVDLWQLGRAEHMNGDPVAAGDAWRRARSNLRRGALRDSIDRALESLQP